jgi:hypothetical protein
VNAAWIRVAAVCVLAASAGCGGSGEPSARAGDAGATVELPADWHATEPYDGNVVDPVTRLVVASAPIAHEPRGCQVSSYRFADDGVALILVEWQGPAVTPGTRFAKRPGRFTSRTLSVRPPPAIECFDGPGGSAQFQDAGHTFGAYVLLGRHAPERLADEARAVLDTLVVDP